MKGSHNSLSYGRPLHWWWRPVGFVWRCQRKTVKEQVAAGVRAFDVRVVIDKGLRIYAAHGRVTVKVSVWDALREIDDAFEGRGKACVRLVLERGGDRDKELFRTLCAEAESSCRNIRFYGGTYKPTWEYLHDFDGGPELESTLYQHVGSMKTWWGAVWPWLWARLHRHDVPQKDLLTTEPPIVLMDFV